MAKDDGSMMVVSNKLIKLEHISKGSVLALSSSGWSLKRLFPYGSAALVPCLPDLLANALYNHLPYQVKRGTIMFIPELVHNLASALSGVDNPFFRSHGERTEIYRLVDRNRRGAYCRRVYNIRIDLRVYRNQW